MTGIKQMKMQPRQKNPLVPFIGDHDNDCYICDDGGDLVCCDFCSKAYHLQCHIPPLLRVPDGVWTCCECKATRKYEFFQGNSPIKTYDF